MVSMFGLIWEIFTVTKITIFSVESCEDLLSPRSLIHILEFTREMKHKCSCIQRL